MELKLKTALCLSGQSRTFNKCIDSLIEYIIKPLNADIFFHLWETSDTPKYMEKSWYGLDKTPDWPSLENIDYIREILIKLNPKGWIIEPQKIFDDSLYRANCTPANSRMQAVNFQHPLSMFYSIKMANALKYRHEILNDFKYDCVIRARPDMKFAKIVPQEYLQDLTKLYFFKKDSHGGLNDRFAFSNSENMNKYADCFDNLPDLFNNGCNIHPETIVKANADFHKLNYFGIETLGELIR